MVYSPWGHKRVRHDLGTKITTTNKTYTKTEKSKGGGELKCKHKFKF